MYCGMSESLGNNPENFNPEESSSEVMFEVVWGVVLEVVFDVEEWCGSRRGTVLEPFNVTEVEDEEEEEEEDEKEEEEEEEEEKGGTLCVAELVFAVTAVLKGVVKGRGRREERGSG
jgi:TATA-binding protein-associated factor Taf7